MKALSLFTESASAYPLDAPEDKTVSYARVGRQSDGVYNKLYLGQQRAPRHADERGAFCVIELRCADGERLAIHSISDDPKHMRVESLPPITTGSP